MYVVDMLLPMRGWVLGARCSDDVTIFFVWGCYAGEIVCEVVIFGLLCVSWIWDVCYSFWAGSYRWS